MPVIIEKPGKWEKSYIRYYCCCRINKKNPLGKTYNVLLVLLSRVL